MLMICRFVVTIACVILTGAACKSNRSSEDAPLTQRQAGTLSELDDVGAVPLSPNEDQWVLTVEQEIIQRIMTLSGGALPDTAREAYDLGDVEVFSIAEEMPVMVDDAEVLDISVAGIGETGTSEVVIVQFVVDDHGRVWHTELARGNDGACAQIALFTARSLSFKPGRHRGQAVNVRMSVPITCTYQ